MIKPKEVKQILTDQAHPDVAEFERQRISGEKKYKYILEFNDYKTFKVLYQQVDTAEEEAGIDLLLDHVDPVVRQTESSIEARIKVTVKETQDRYCIENTQLDEFENESGESFK